MARPISIPRSSIPLVACDAAAIAIFVTIGLLSHHGTLSARGYARDTLPLAGGWFAAAGLFDLYGRRRFGRLAATWACGIPAAVLVRALILGRSLNGSEAAFLAVCLVTIGALVLALRAVLALGARAPRRSLPTSARHARAPGEPALETTRSRTPVV